MSTTPRTAKARHTGRRARRSAGCRLPPRKISSARWECRGITGDPWVDSEVGPHSPGAVRAFVAFRYRRVCPRDLRRHGGGRPGGRRPVVPREPRRATGPHAESRRASCTGAGMPMAQGLLDDSERADQWVPHLMCRDGACLDPMVAPHRRDLGISQSRDFSRQPCTDITVAAHRIPASRAAGLSR